MPEIVSLKNAQKLKNTPKRFQIGHFCHLKNGYNIKIWEFCPFQKVAKILPFSLATFLEKKLRPGLKN